MYFPKKLTRLLTLSLLLVALMNLIGALQAQDDEYTILYTGRQMGPSDIPTLDPAFSEDVPSSTAIDQMFVGLSRLNEETVAVEPGMATYEVSEDGLTYTFSITPEIPWVRYNADSGQVEQVMDESGSPRFVTAEDFRYGILRTLDPNLATSYGYVSAAFIAGATEYNSALPPAPEEGQTAEPGPSDEELAALRDAVGVRVVDTYTLEVTAVENVAFLPNIFTMWITYAQPSWAIDEYGASWIEAENINTYGPYTLKEWVHDESLTVIRNPFWPGSDTVPQASIDEVVFLFLDDTTQLANFEAGTLDVSEVPISDIDRIRSDATLSAALHSAPGTCTYWYGFNTQLAPMDDVRVRQAFSMSIDRQAIVENITRRGEIPAYMFTRPEMVAAPNAEDYPESGAPSYGVEYAAAVEEARALFQAYLDETGQTVETLPTITLMHNDSELHATLAQAVQQMWRDALGVEIQITSMDFGTFLQTRRENPTAIFRSAWCYDYPDTNNWLFDVFHSSVDPDVNWNNAEFDALVEQARSERDETARRDLYAQAEQILTRDYAAMAPVYFYSTQDLTRPGIERTYSRILIERYEKWSIVGS